VEADLAATVTNKLTTGSVTGMLTMAFNDVIFPISDPQQTSWLAFPLCIKARDCFCVQHFIDAVW